MFLKFFIKSWWYDRLDSALAYITACFRYFNGVLQETEDTVSKVELLPNGTWQPVEGADSRAAAVAPAIDVEEIQIVDDENTSGDKVRPVRGYDAI